MSSRQDIHKACRTTDALLAVLADYSDAAAAFAALQKKLAKTLKDAAGLKANAQFAANAFGASSVILEALADIDAKFAKLAEKESHALSSDVNKWFKKLAKLEKAHDERMVESNARIKQAGQAYEKKSKKGSKDVGDEHARYINLLSVIGPEMSQAKYDHALHVTQQHTLVTFNVAATLARIADAEWTRACECMRRISPTIGSLGEWRSLCEGAWTGPLPGALPDPSSESQVPVSPAVSEWGQTALSSPLRRSLPVPPLTNHSPGSAASSLDAPRSPFIVANQNQNQGSINSITTLSAFPFPPTHFPLPLATNEAELLRQQTQPQPPHSRAASPIAAVTTPILTEPIAAADLPESLAYDATKAASHQSPIVEPPVISPEFKDGIKQSGGDPKKPRITRVPVPSDKPTRPVTPFKRAGHSSPDNEFGVHTDGSTSGSQSRSVDATKQNLERADSTLSTGNNVAALRNKYTRTVETPSQGPKDVPRLPMSVSEIASRYQSVDEPRRTASPILPPDTPARRDFPLDENEIRRRKQRIEELAELDLKEKEYELRQRERDLNQRTRDFERDRRHFLNARPEPGSTADGPKGPRTSPFRHMRGSRSVTHLSQTSSTMTTTTSSSDVALRPSTSHSPQPLQAKDHAPFCGCDTCSVSKYKTTDGAPSPRDLRPPEPPIVLRPERPKGWIRRLSMPSVNVAFSLDTKKNASAVSLKAGLPLPAENGRLRKRSYEQGVSNRALASVGRR